MVRVKRDEVSGKGSGESATSPSKRSFHGLPRPQKNIEGGGIASRACDERWGSEEARDRPLESPICGRVAARPSSSLGPIWAPLIDNDTYLLLCITSRCVMIHKMGPEPLADFSFSFLDRMIS